MTDRRRVNGPPGGTVPPVFTSSVAGANRDSVECEGRTRAAHELRNIFLKTGLTPSASGSAYLELEPSTTVSKGTSLTNISSSLKLTCTVHGPRPLPRSAPFSPHLLLSTHVKFASFAARQRRGYIRDSSGRGLGAHLENALRGILIAERWPKSGLEVIIIVLEGEGDCLEFNGHGAVGEKDGSASGWGLMSTLAGCITVASAAIADAGIDCVDLVTGGVAAIVRQSSNTSAQQPQRQSTTGKEADVRTEVIMDPCPSEHQVLLGVCVVAYLHSRDEITEIWAKGDLSRSSNAKSSEQCGLESIIDRAVEAASSARLVLIEALKESTELKISKCEMHMKDDQNRT